MLDAFQEYLKSEGLLEARSKTLLAVSGGIDSMVMADLFRRAQIDFGIAHCNFKLRDDADEDEIFVRHYAEGLNIPFHTYSFNTTKEARARGISIQMAARDLRYNWFELLLAEEGYSAVATAHHRDDEYETVLFNLIKGTGIDGLTGMKSRESYRIHPMLFATRSMVEEYADQFNIRWREDVSNSQLRYQRNRIRHEIISIVEKINPGFRESFVFTKKRLIEVANVLNRQLETSTLSSHGHEGTLNIEKNSIKRNPAPTITLFRDLKKYGFNYKQCVLIFETIDAVGKIFESNTHVLNVDRSTLILTPREKVLIEPAILQEDTLSASVSNRTFRIESNPGSLENLPENPPENVAFLDSDQLYFPLRIRKWEHGDSFVPLGMTGQKKLSDFMIDSKIPVNLKREVLVVESMGNIVWVVGHRIDNRYKILQSTKRITKISYSYEEN